MEEKEYYLRSRENNLPLRCPIVNYCSRRAVTIDLFSEHSKHATDVDLISILQNSGDLPLDFREKAIDIQGESPSIIRGANNYYFSKVCPEVNLFDNWNALIYGKACSAGSYDKYYHGEKTRAEKFKHFSECAEFNKYLFDNNQVGKVKKKPTRKSISFKTKALLQKEINSKCPFCANEDVEHFQVHHIDESPENNNVENLLMLCPNCHSKITKRDISFESVRRVKDLLN